MRDVAREPKQLELERECERIQGSASCQVGSDRIHRREKPRQRLESALIPLLLDEEAQHRFDADESDREPIRVLAGRAMRIDERGTRDRVELARALVQEKLRV